MAHFNRRLNASKVLKWSDYYINYSALRRRVDDCSVSEFKNSSPGKYIKLLETDDNEGFGADGIANFRRAFVTEMKKVSSKFQEEVKEIRGRLELLETQKKALPELLADARDLGSIKEGLIDVYREVIMLQSFGILNFTGFMKILQRFESKTADSNTKQTLLTELEQEDFGNTKSLQGMIDEIEAIVAKWYCDGSVAYARSTLLARRVSPFNWTHFHVGMRFGAAVVLLVWLVWDCVVDVAIRPNAKGQWLDLAMPIYRFCGCMILASWCWGVNVHVWSTFRINYMYLLELDSNATLSAESVFRRSLDATIIFLINFLLFFKANRDELGEKGIGAGWSFAFPVTLFLMVLVVLIWIIFQNKKFWARAIWQTLISPLGKVNFQTAYVGDVMTSMVKVSIDCGYAFCWISHGWWEPETNATSAQCTSAWGFKFVFVPAVSALPLWLRFMQNIRRYWETHQRFPALANAGKYAIAQCVVLLGVIQSNFTAQPAGFQVIWVVIVCISTLYAFVWDITQDWSLFEPGSFRLRRRRMLPRTWFYYCAAVIDLFLRFGWTMTYLGVEGGPFQGPLFQIYLNPILASAEVIRRSIWSWFRLENEHLHNTQGYRRVDFVPLHFETATKATPPETKKKGASIIFEVIIFAIVVAAVSLFAVLSPSF